MTDYATRILAVMTARLVTLDTIKKKTGLVGLNHHMQVLLSTGKIIKLDGKYRIAKDAPKSATTKKVAPKKPKKKVQAIEVTEASVKAELDIAIQSGDAAIIGRLCTQVFDGFVHAKSQEFHKLRYIANWARTKPVSGSFLADAYTLLVGTFLPFVVKLRNGDCDIDKERLYDVHFMDDGNVSHTTKVRAICPSRAVVQVRKSQRNGFHLNTVMEAQ